MGMHAEMTELDTVMTAYRCHAWALMLGVTPLGVIAELMGATRLPIASSMRTDRLAGRATGVAMGKGGSMHMYAPKFYGGSGIVGAQVTHIEINCASHD